jgi:hypothetical protein
MLTGSGDDDADKSSTASVVLSKLVAARQLLEGRWAGSGACDVGADISIDGDAIILLGAGFLIRTCSAAVEHTCVEHTCGSVTNDIGAGLCIANAIGAGLCVANAIGAGLRVSGGGINNDAGAGHAGSGTTRDGV